MSCSFTTTVENLKYFHRLDKNVSQVTCFKKKRASNRNFLFHFNLGNIFWLWQHLLPFVRWTLGAGSDVIRMCCSELYYCQKLQKALVSKPWVQYCQMVHLVGSIRLDKSTRIKKKKKHPVHKNCKSVTAPTQGPS